MFEFAILGGAFNPIHNGHLYIADEIISKNIAQKVVFMPNGNHPLKTTSLLLPFKERFHLIELAIMNKPNFAVSDLDSPQYGINYTYNLIQRISKNYSLQQFTFLIGYDNALNFLQWYKPEWLLNNVHFTVVNRNSDNSEANVIDQRFKLVEIKPYDISSSEIRDKLQRDQDVTGLVPKQTIDQLMIYWKKLKLSSHH